MVEDPYHVRAVGFEELGKDRRAFAVDADDCDGMCFGFQLHIM
jgi:hypothetical protein